MPLIYALIVTEHALKYLLRLCNCCPHPHVAYYELATCFTENNKIIAYLQKRVFSSKYTTNRLAAGFCPDLGEA